VGQTTWALPTINIALSIEQATCQLLSLWKSNGTITEETGILTG
jgi:hypothetical protein